MSDKPKVLTCLGKLLYGDYPEPEPERDEEEGIGTCQGCGSYGPLGSLCVRNGEECGERL